jgi:hypothetical protein
VSCVWSRQTIRLSLVARGTTWSYVHWFPRFLAKREAQAAAEPALEANTHGEAAAGLAGGVERERRGEGRSEGPDGRFAVPGGAGVDIHLVVLNGTNGFTVTPIAQYATARTDNPERRGLTGWEWDSGAAERW